MIKLELENNLWKKYNIICGVDEVGRGCFAGPVVAGAVCFSNGFTLPEALACVTDSKKLSANQREHLAPIIKHYAACYSIAEVPAAIVDDINILQATFRAMNTAITSLPLTPDFLLIDGNRFSSPLTIPYQTIIKGDLHVFSIACASIIAKVHRDKLMVEQSRSFPQYGFETNVGYGTKRHIEAIKQYGLTPLHRKTFIHF